MDQTCEQYLKMDEVILLQIGTKKVKVWTLAIAPLT